MFWILIPIVCTIQKGGSLYVILGMLFVFFLFMLFCFILYILLQNKCWVPQLFTYWKELFLHFYYYFFLYNIFVRFPVVGSFFACARISIKKASCELYIYIQFLLWEGKKLELFTLYNIRPLYIAKMLNHSRNKGTFILYRYISDDKKKEKKIGKNIIEKLLILEDKRRKDIMWHDLEMIPLRLYPKTFNYLFTLTGEMENENTKKGFLIIISNLINLGKRKNWKEKHTIIWKKTKTKCNIKTFTNSTNLPSLYCKTSDDKHKKKILQQ